ncbi:cysteine desulfurase family protein [Xanthobacter sp. TB0136]|uniref:cysteine desulfurase family protein n=1 Tax=Xanthobacter sp. TB0136 TaxID=3459177 RepID=UPI00403A4D83
MDLQDKDGSGRRRVYLDHNATAPLHPQARAAALACMDGPCNASSIHAQGRAARAVVEKARGEVARLVGAPGRNVVFTSGATEALALALQPDMELAGKPVHCDILLASAVEHPAVLRGHRFADMETIEVDASGRLVPDALEEALERHAAAGRRALVAIMAANNETGVLQPVAEAARLAHRHGAVVLCDAVQAAGRVNLDIKALDVDFLALSAHKIGGLQGAGALVSAEATHRLPALLAGGGQERGRRGGTENVPAIAAFGAAAKRALESRESEAARLCSLRDRLERAILETVSGSHVIGHDAERLANTTLIAFENVRAETLVIALDLAHISVSSGAACSSGKVGASHVLAAMGVDAAHASGAVRLSLGWSSDGRDIDLAVAAFGEVVPRVRGRPVRTV